MNSVSGLIARLERAEGLDRRLDAEVVAAVLGPPGCVLNPFETPDGWDIEQAPDKNGETGYWMEAADVPPITSSLDEAAKMLGEARPEDAAAIMARALTACPPLEGQCAPTYTSRLARSISAELLRSIAIEQLKALLDKTPGTPVQAASAAV